MVGRFAFPEVGADVRTIGPRQMFRRLHADQTGAVSLETVLLIGAVALPVLIFLVKFGWPRVRDYFSRNMQVLQNESNSVSGQQ